MGLEDSDPGELPADPEEEAVEEAPEAQAAPERVETLLEEPLLVPPTLVNAKHFKHDPREVRRVIAMAFSAGELSKFAERWRVFTDREGSVDDGARTLVRAVDGRGKLAQLVDSLRAHKPLFEWPEPTIEVDEPPPGTEATADTAPSDRARSDRAPSDPTPAAPAKAPIIDPYPAQAEASQAEAEGFPTRWLLIAGAVVIAGAAAGITAAVMGGGGDGEVVSLAGDAAFELEQSVKAVRQACKVEPDDDSARGQLAAAFRRCSVPEIRPSRIDIPIPKRPVAAPAPTRPVLPKRPAAPVSRTPKCLDQCHNIHNQCKTSQCGSEPASAQAYEQYQKCLASCLSQYSRCRLTCR